MKHRRHHILFRFLNLVLLLLMLSPGAVCAAPGDGDGSGGGSSIPLTMTASVPENGADDVSLNPSFTFQYSHNVANAEVSEGNLDHISMKKEDGTEVTLQTWAADVQIEFDKRRMLYARPASTLEPGTHYTIILSAGIQAKNGMTTTSDQTVSFTTMGNRSVEQSPVPSRENSSGEASGSGAGSTAENHTASGDHPTGLISRPIPPNPESTEVSRTSTPDQEAAPQEEPSGSAAGQTTENREPEGSGADNPAPGPAQETEDSTSLYQDDASALQEEEALPDSAEGNQESTLLQDDVPPDSDSTDKEQDDPQKPAERSGQSGKFSKDDTIVLSIAVFIVILLITMTGIVFYRKRMKRNR